MKGTAFTRLQARRALNVLEEAFDTGAGWELAVELEDVRRIFGALTLLADYIDNSKAIPLKPSEPTREELYAQQVGASAA